MIHTLSENSSSKLLNEGFFENKRLRLYNSIKISFCNMDTAVDKQVLIDTLKQSSTALTKGKAGKIALGLAGLAIGGIGAYASYKAGMDVDSLNKDLDAIPTTANDGSNSLANMANATARSLYGRHVADATNIENGGKLAIGVGALLSIVSTVIRSGNSSDISRSKAIIDTIIQYISKVKPGKQKCVEFDKKFKQFFINESYNSDISNSDDNVVVEMDVVSEGISNLLALYNDALPESISDNILNELLTDALFLFNETVNFENVSEFTTPTFIEDYAFMTEGGVLSENTKDTITNTGELATYKKNIVSAIFENTSDNDSVEINSFTVSKIILVEMLDGLGLLQNISESNPQIITDTVCKMSLLDEASKSKPFRLLGSIRKEFCHMKTTKDKEKLLKRLDGSVKALSKGKAGKIALGLAGLAALAGGAYMAYDAMKNGENIKDSENGLLSTLKNAHTRAGFTQQETSNGKTITKHFLTKMGGVAEPTTKLGYEANNLSNKAISHLSANKDNIKKAFSGAIKDEENRALTGKTIAKAGAIVGLTSLLLKSGNKKDISESEKVIKNVISYVKSVKPGKQDCVDFDKKFLI